jgi:hypothetical protein
MQDVPYEDATLSSTELLLFGTLPSDAGAAIFLLQLSKHTAAGQGAACTAVLHDTAVGLWSKAQM